MHIDRYERIWLVVISVVLAVFFAALVAGVVIFGVELPEPTEGSVVNPRNLDEVGFDDESLGIRQLGQTDDGAPSFEVRIRAQRWSFVAGSHEIKEDKQVIRVPEGAYVSFRVASSDITHGFIIEKHNVNFELIPGHIAVAGTTFDRPGEYLIACHEYCGSQHQAMWMWLIVETQEEWDERIQNEANQPESTAEPEMTAEPESTPDPEATTEPETESTPEPESTPDVEGTDEPANDSEED